MIVWVDDGLFAGGACDVDRFALLRGAAKRRHTLIVSTDPNDTRMTRQAPSFDRWRNGLSPKLQQEMRVLLERLAFVSVNATTRGAERLLVSAQEWPGVYGARLTLEEAVRAVVLPTCVLLENAINDGAFLRQAMPRAWREKLAKWEADGLLRFEQGGGISEVKNIVEYFADDANSRRSFGLPSKLWCRVHIVVYDHDGLSGTDPSPQSQDVERKCRESGLAARSHRLTRRKQENYLPRPAMEEMVQKRFQSFPDKRDKYMQEVREHFECGPGFHFKEIPRFEKNMLKNAFAKAEKDWQQIDWQDEWFEDVWPEMTQIAEMIATAI